LRRAWETLKAGRPRQTGLQGRDLKTGCGGATEKRDDQGSAGLDPDHLPGERQLQTENHGTGEPTVREGGDAWQDQEGVQWVDGEVPQNSQEGHYYFYHD